MFDEIVRPASVELHHFRDRIFVAGPSWGVELPANAPPEHVGAELLRGLVGERARRRPIIDTLTRHLRRDRGESSGWERFCRGVVGVEVAQYRPQVQIECLVIGDGQLRLRDLNSHGGEEEDRVFPRDVDADELGEAAVALASFAVPVWPSVGGARIHVATRKRLIVVPSRFFAAEPVRVVPWDAEPRAVGEAVLLALADSDLIDPSARRPRTPWEQKLRDAGTSSRQIAGKRAAHVAALADGTIRVTADHAVRGGWEPTGESGEVVLPDRDPDRLGRAVVAAVITWDPWSGSHLGSMV